MIRRASVEDIPSIRAMADIAFRDTYKDILSPEQMEYMMDWMYSEANLRDQMESRGDVFCIEEGRGYVSFRPDGSAGDGRKLFHLEKLYVLPRWQKTGLGRKLFDRAVAEMRDAAGGSPLRVELNVNRSNPAVSFYEHLGMVKDRTGDFPIGGGFFMNDYIMAKDY